MTANGPLRLGELEIRAERPFLIAEAGVNHEGNISTALKMVEVASKSGADAIKFQSYRAETLASRNSPAYWNLSAEPTRSQFELFTRYGTFGEAEFARLAEEARDQGIHFLSTPFDEHFAEALSPLMPAIKIASADLTNIPLIRLCAGKGKPLLLSLGGSTVGEIVDALAAVREAGDPPVALLHCVLSYPCRPEDANLLNISWLRRLFPEHVVGYSDHVKPDPLGACLTTAWLLGARIIEKHFTLDKSLPGNDHYHAADGDDIRAFRAHCDYVTSLLGDERKRVLEAELEGRKQARRSLVATRSIRKGETIVPDMIIPKRPGTGIPPTALSQIIGSRPRRDIDEDEVLTWDMFIERAEEPALGH